VRTYEENLFLATISDLATRARSNNAYELLQSAALLRKLLLDGNRLLDLANREHRLKIMFDVRGYLPPSEPTPGKFKAAMMVLGDMIDPQVMPQHAGGIRQVNRDGLLKTVVAFAGTSWLTIHDVIDFEAHVAGAVHVGTPQTDAEKATAALASFVHLGGLRPSLMELRAISRVVLRGVEPLNAAIEAKK